MADPLATFVQRLEAFGQWAKREGNYVLLDMKPNPTVLRRTALVMVEALKLDEGGAALELGIDHHVVSSEHSSYAIKPTHDRLQTLIERIE